jgi:aspartyl-tRNA(Asn)/glutamyl-tRNA(Gln) amidotransferase subunit A
MLAYGARQSREREAEIRARLAAAAEEVRALFDGIDALLLPTTPQAAFAHGSKVPDNQSELCGLANIAGLPAISIPWGVDHDGMPLGLQIIGAGGQDARVLEIACRLEAERR